MTPSDQVKRNLGLAFEVVQAAISDPDVAAEVRERSAEGGFVLADPTDAELSLANQHLVEVLRARGESVTFLEVQKTLTLHPAG